MKNFASPAYVNLNQDDSSRIKYLIDIIATLLYDLLPVHRVVALLMPTEVHFELSGSHWYRAQSNQRMNLSFYANSCVNIVKLFK